MYITYIRQDTLAPFEVKKTKIRNRPKQVLWQTVTNYSVGRCVIPCAFFGKSVKHIFSCSKMYPD